MNEVDFTNYPHMPFSHRAIIREFVSISNDEPLTTTAATVTRAAVVR